MEFVNIRLASHQLCGTRFKTPEEIVSWMGAMQAQDYNMAKWGIGIRLPGYSEKMLEDTFNKGVFLRTHVLRPTWHFVAPENIRWMLKLTKERIKSSSRSRDRDLEITEELYTKTNNIIEKALTGHNYQTREELSIVLKNAGIAVDTSRMIHFMMRAEVEGIVCSGAMKGKKHTYALIEERVPKTVSLSKEESLATLARMYFLSHSPATLQDFVWWSGLATAEARQGLEAVKAEFVTETINDRVYWIPCSLQDSCKKTESLYLLPAFDEYIVAYSDRKNILPSDNNYTKAISSNGVFRPVIVKDGKVIGIWKMSATKKRTAIPEFFEPVTPGLIELFEKGVIRLSDF